MKSNHVSIDLFTYQYLHQHKHHDYAYVQLVAPTACIYFRKCRKHTASRLCESSCDTSESLNRQTPYYKPHKSDLSHPNVCVYVLLNCLKCDTFSNTSHSCTVFPLKTTNLHKFNQTRGFTRMRSHMYLQICGSSCTLSTNRTLKLLFSSVGSHVGH